MQCILGSVLELPAKWTECSGKSGEAVAMLVEPVVVLVLEPAAMVPLVVRLYSSNNHLPLILLFLEQADCGLVVSKCWQS